MLLLTGGILAISALYVGVDAYKKSQNPPEKTLQKSEQPKILKKELLEKECSQSLEVSSIKSKREISKSEKRANLELNISFISLGLAITGTLFYPPLALLSMPWFIYSGIPMFKDAYKTFKEKNKVGVDALSSVVIVTCVVNQYYVISNLATITYFLSRKLLQQVKIESKKNVIDVFKQQPHSTWVLTDDGVEIEIPFEQLKAGDTIVVNAGGIISADGTITDGIATIDQHILTGESQPAEKGLGEPVFASTVVLSGKIYISVEKAGEQTVVAQIGKILNNTADFKPTTQLRAEIITDKTIVPTLLIGGLSLPFIGPNGAVAVLNSHYKYKMGIVAPISILNFLTLMSQNQILIKEGRTLDLLNQIDTIVFDKTGTLTEEQPHVGQIHSCSGYDENAVLIYAAAAEYKQSHPIARAILVEAKTRQLSLPTVDEAEYKMGHGLTVMIDKQIVRVGSLRFLEAEGIIIPPPIKTIWEDSHNQGHSLVMVGINEQLMGAIELLPTVRPEAKESINRLRQRHHIKSMYIISGDHETPTKKLAQELGIDDYFAETLPENKAQIIEQLQAEGKFVCFVGDGINDAIALKKAQVSISLRGASTVATDTAQIILMDGHLNQLVLLFDLAKEFEKNMNVGFMTLLIPTAIGMTGALFFHFGLATTMLLSYSGLSIGVMNSMWPLIKYQQNSPTKLLNKKVTITEMNTSNECHLDLM